MIRPVLFAVACLASAPVAATVCQSQGNVIADYEYAASEEAAYVIAVGQLENLRAAEPLDSAGSYRQTARFEGSILIGTGFAPGWSTDLVVTGLCQGGGCGAHQAERDGLFFFERTEDGFTFLADACGGLVHYEPTRADLDAITQCHTGGCQ